MQIQVFSIRDGKSCVFGMPFFRVNKGVAMRDFSDLVNDVQTSIHKHPDDFKLYSLGEFDDNSGEFVSLPQPEFLAHGSDFINIKVQLCLRNFLLCLMCLMLKVIYQHLKLLSY